MFVYAERIIELTHLNSKPKLAPVWECLVNNINTNEPTNYRKEISHPVVKKQVMIELHIELEYRLLGSFISEGKVCCT